MLQLLVFLGSCGISTARILAGAGMNGAGGLEPPIAESLFVPKIAGMRWPGVIPAHPAVAAMAGATVFDRAARVAGTAEVGGISEASFLFSLTTRSRRRQQPTIPAGAAGPPTSETGIGRGRDAVQPPASCHNIVFSQALIG